MKITFYFNFNKINNFNFSKINNFNLNKINKALFFLPLTILLLLVIQTAGFAFSFEKFAEKYQQNDNSNVKYRVLLQNGDIVSGYIIELLVADTNQSNFKKILDSNDILKNKINKTIQQNTEIFCIMMNTLLGEMIIYADEIKNITMQKDSEQPNHSIFIMPTANPIKKNHFIGNYELAFFYTGIGFGDCSITAGRSIIPLTTSDNQISVVNAKVSLPRIGAEDSSNATFAVGGNFLWLGSHNKVFHLYAIGTYNSLELDNSNFTCGIFYKIGYQDYPSTIRLFDRIFNFDYPDGAFGICAGFDRRFSTRRDLSLIAEIWNADVTRPTNTAILVGLKLSGKNFSSTFGLTVVTEPIAFPFFNFIWTPFN
jgi:hypothetical protein